MDVFLDCVTAVEKVTPNGFAAVKLTALGNPELLKRVSTALVEGSCVMRVLWLNAGMHVDLGVCGSFCTPLDCRVSSCGESVSQLAPCTCLGKSRVVQGELSVCVHLPAAHSAWVIIRTRAHM